MSVEVYASKLGCPYCAGEPTPGYIEHPDNGPVTPCPMCNPQTDRQREYGLALEQQRALQRALRKSARLVSRGKPTPRSNRERGDD